MAGEVVEPLETKDKIQILLQEYGGLRTEIIHRYNNIYQLITVGAVVFVWAVSHPPDSTLWFGFGASVVTISFFSWSLRLDTARAAERAREIEQEINELAGEELMAWETHWGGHVRGFFGRSKPSHRSKEPL
jgi:hypothetical protein